MNKKNYQLSTINYQLNTGFTLIELIIVIAVLTILIGIASPSLIKYKEREAERERIAHEEVINRALMQCYALEGKKPENDMDESSDEWAKWKDILNSRYNMIFYDKYEYSYDAADGICGKITVE